MDDLFSDEDYHVNNDDEDDGVKLEADDDSDTLSDDGDLEPLEKTTLKYVVANEAFPKLAAYDARITEVREALKALLNSILVILHRSPADSTHATGFQRKAEDLITVPRPKPVKIGCSALLVQVGKDFDATVCTY